MFHGTKVCPANGCEGRSEEGAQTGEAAGIATARQPATRARHGTFPFFTEQEPAMYSVQMLS